MAVAQRSVSDLGLVRYPQIVGDRGGRFTCPVCRVLNQPLPEDIPYGQGSDVDYTFDCGRCRSVFALDSGSGDQVIFEVAVAQHEYKAGAKSYKGLALATSRSIDELPPVLRGYADSLEHLAAAQAAVDAHAAEVLGLLSTREADRALKAAGIKSSRATINRQAQAHAERQVVHEIPEF